MTNLAGVEMRKAYALTVQELFERDSKVFALEADLSQAMGTTFLKDLMGPNFVNVGIMEAHLVSLAAGIGIRGGYSFVHSFGQFLARRALDQAFVSLAYAGLSACLVGSDAGVTAEHNGGTHMTFEDLGIMRTIPKITIYEVCDPNQFRAVLHAAHEQGGLTYVRTIRKTAPREIYPENVAFQAAGGQVLRAGSDVTLVATGIEVSEALTAAELLADEGISAEVLDLFRVKPLDRELLLASVAQTRRVVTCENHNVINGLGSAVAEVLSEEQPTPLRRIGVHDAFGQVGTTAYLLDHYGLSAQHIVAAAKSLF